jgi:crossover junction endodeoxyribonuclease RusA
MTTKTVVLPYPPSANRYWRTNRQTGKPYKSEEARAYIEAVGWECAIHGLTDPALEDVSVRARFARPAGRRIDLDNGIKILIDALQGYAYANDKQVIHIEAEIAHIPKGRDPYVVVTIRPAVVQVLEDA